MPVLFLDYDGVLHPDAVYRTRQGLVLMREGVSLFEWVRILEEALAPHPEMRIVLSTAWVRVLGFDEARGRLPEALQERVVGATWHSRMDRAEWQALSRFGQVLRYVQRHRVAHWLAVDDDAQDWARECHGNLVHTHAEFGLSLASTRAELREKLARLAGSSGASSPGRPAE